MTILAGNRHLRLKVMLRGPKLWVNLILNVIGVRLRSTGTHFDHNRYIIRTFIFGVFYRSLWSHAKVSDPLYRGVLKIFFRKLLLMSVRRTSFKDSSTYRSVLTACLLFGDWAYVDVLTSITLLSPEWFLDFLLGAIGYISVDNFANFGHRAAPFSASL